jgi:hypothetical protein
LEQLVKRLALVLRSLTVIEFIQQTACDECDTEEVRDGNRRERWSNVGGH